jgi:hypothetical protein
MALAPLRQGYLGARAVGCQPYSGLGFTIHQDESRTIGGRSELYADRAATAAKPQLTSTVFGGVKLRDNLATGGNKLDQLGANDLLNRCGGLRLGGWHHAKRGQQMSSQKDRDGR